MKNPIANPVVVLREEFDDWAILFNPDTAEAMGTNPTGAAVWKLMDGRHSLEDMIAEIQKCFDGVSQTVGEEITAFIRGLTDQGFAGYEMDPDL
jgi:SynChlorMet cassette protein ScmD